MKKIDSIIIHCSATRAGQDIKAKDIDRMHLSLIHISEPTRH